MHSSPASRVLISSLARCNDACANPQSLQRADHVAGPPTYRPFPHAATALGPLEAAAEKLGRVDFTNLWAGQAVRMGREMPAAELTRAPDGQCAGPHEPDGGLTRP